MESGARYWMRCAAYTGNVAGVSGREKVSRSPRELSSRCNQDIGWWHRTLAHPARPISARWCLCDVAMQHSRKQIFCPDELINLFVVNLRGDLCQREGQHPSCGCDGVGEKFMT
jgi:hypothetical protein